jgi:hypothetical protein
MAAVARISEVSHGFCCPKGEPSSLMKEVTFAIGMDRSQPCLSQERGTLKDMPVDKLDTEEQSKLASVHWGVSPHTLSFKRGEGKSLLIKQEEGSVSGFRGP